MPNARPRNSEVVLAEPSMTPRLQQRCAPADELYIDVVCSDAVCARSDTPRWQWGDDTFFFCSPFCQRRFCAEPEVFMSARRGDPDQPRSGDDHAAA